MSSKINLQTCEYARKSSIFQDNQLILYKKAKEGYAGLTCRSVKKWEDRDKEVWLSDHYPICAELEWINL